VNSNLNPGAGPNPEAVEPAEAAEKLWRVLMSKGIEDTGKFWHREGFEYVGSTSRDHPRRSAD